MNHWSYLELVCATALMALLPTLYMGGYYGTVERHAELDSRPPDGVGPPFFYRVGPKYRFGGDIFFVAHAIDRKLRPAVWSATTEEQKQADQVTEMLRGCCRRPVHADVSN